MGLFGWFIPSRPVAPVDPGGTSTNRLGPSYPGPVGNRPPVAVPPIYSRVCTYPYSDTYNDPTTVMDREQASRWPTLVASQLYLKKINLLGDANGLPTPYARRLDTFIPMVSRTNVAGTYMLRPNLGTVQPQGVKMSLMEARFQNYLRAVQHRLIGSP